MDIKALKFDQTTTEALQALKLQVELHEKRITRPQHSIRELVDLIEIGLRSDSPPVNSALRNLCDRLNPRQLAFFKNLGIDLSRAHKETEQKISYRGAQLTKKKPELDSVESAVPPKKKKVIYRGQEKWV